MSMNRTFSSIGPFNGQFPIVPAIVTKHFGSFNTGAITVFLGHMPTMLASIPWNLMTGIGTVNDISAFNKSSISPTLFFNIKMLRPAVLSINYGSIRHFSSNFVLNSPHNFALKSRVPLQTSAAKKAYLKSGNIDMVALLTLHQIVEKAIAAKQTVTADFVNKVLSLDEVCTKTHLDYIQSLTPTTFAYPLVREQLDLAKSVLGTTREPVAGIYHFRETVNPYNHGVGQTTNFRNRLVMYKSTTRVGAIIR